jgi:beta-xylosidase
MSIAAGAKLGRYEIRAKIGEGGMGEVHRACLAKMNRFVSAALRSLLLLLVASAIPVWFAAGTEFAANRSQSSALSARFIADSQLRSGNPIITGWYADPEAHIFKNEYWVYPTYSAAYDEQVFFDAFSSKDLITWKKHPRIFANVDAPWVKRALWAPSVIEKGGWYYLFFGANDIQNDQQLGGIGVARSRQPGGPFKDYLGKPLIDKFHNGAQPIDQFVFRDGSSSYYIIYGGWRHCNIAKLNDNFTGLIPFDNGATFKEITPKGYVEGSFMFMKDGKYYFMWSEGGWTGPDYAVAYAVGSSVFGPFERIGKILQQNPSVATGAGHHSVLHKPGSARWYIVYHRRPLGETDRNHRVVCIDEMHFDDRGLIQPVVITKDGVPRDALRP